MRPASVTWFSRHGRGIVLDVVVVVCNLFLLGRLARVLREGGRGFLAPGEGAGAAVSPEVGWLFLAVFAAYTAGIWLKRAAPRAAASPRVNGPARKVMTAAACTLLVFHFFIFMTLLVTGWQSTPLDGFSPLFGTGTTGNGFGDFIVRFVLFIFVLPLPTGLTLWSLFAREDAPASGVLARPAVQLVADVLLYFSVVAITLIMNVLIAPRFVDVEGAHAWTAGGVLASLVPLMLAFAIFYLPPRLVYLASDYRSPLAWLTIVLALLTLAYRTFFPAAH